MNNLKNFNMGAIKNLTYLDLSNNPLEKIEVDEKAVFPENVDFPESLKEICFKGWKKKLGKRENCIVELKKKGVKIVYNNGQG